MSMVKIEYEGSVYLYNAGYAEEVVERSKEELAKHGVDPADIKIIEKPEDVPIGSILVTVWAHSLEVARVRKVIEGSIISANLFSIEI